MFNPSTETIAKVSQVTVRAREEDTQVIKLGGVSSTAKLHESGEHCKHPKEHHGVAHITNNRQEEQNRDYRVAQHKATQTHKSRDRKKKVAKQVRFAAEIIDIEKEMRKRGDNPLQTCNKDEVKVYKIEAQGIPQPLIMEFARSQRIHSIRPKAIRRYLRTVHALTAGEDIDQAREQFMERMKSKYPDVFSTELKDKGISPVKLYIPLYNEQLYKPPHIYPVPNAYRERVKQTIDEMIEQGVLRHSKSHFAAPLTCVKKKDGSIRVCTDFRALNAIVKQDKYVIPHIDYIKKHILGNVFTTLDLKNGFQQVLIHEPDRYKTAMATPWGLLEYCRMPFGLKNAPNTFQRFINIVLYGLKNLYVYIDDVIIFSEDVEQHIAHVSAVFERLNQYDLIINKQKSHFFREKIEYLGLEFSSDGYRPVQ